MTTTHPAHERTTRQSSRSASPKRKSHPKDAFALLKSDHAEVKKLFADFEKAGSDTRKEALAASICTALTIHATIEEELLYPAARQYLPEEDQVDEATVEHQTAKDLIAAIQAGTPEEELWEAKVKVLSEYIEHHVKEEEKEMFPTLRKTDLDAKALGEQLLARKQELTKELS